jgi:N-acylneuraminate cytidylyltransferase
MVDGKKILGVIPARGGSKGVPGKNIRLAGGKPLIAWVIQAARKSRYIDRLVVSTDDEKIMAVAVALGCEAPFMRPSELAGDESPTALAILHAVERMPGFDYVVTLQPTSPLTEPGDIDSCILKCVREKADACVSVVAVSKSPYWMFTLENEDVLSPLMGSAFLKKRRQDLPLVYVPNGAVYVTACDFLKKVQTLYADRTLGHVMAPEKSIDIDTAFDFLFFETVISKERKDGGSSSE